jgi:ABC-type branched-subunit amino acid transport system substrate-binding protein
MNAFTKYSVLLALVAAISLTGCTPEEKGVSSEEIKFGTWAPLTGPASHLSASAKAIDAYFKYINEEEGGVHDHTLTLVTKDDGYDASRTPDLVTELIEQDQVFGIVGGLGTDNCLSVMDYLATQMVPWVTPGSGSRIWTTPVHAYRFSTYPSYVTEGKALGRYAVEEFEGERIGIFYQDDSYGREGEDGVRLGIRAGSDLDDFIAVTRYKIGDTDFSSQVKYLKDKVIDVLVLWAMPEYAKGLLEEIQRQNDEVMFRSMEFHPKLLGGGLLADPSMAETAGPEWEGAVVATNVPDPNSDEPGVVRAREILAKYAPDVPFGTAALTGMIRAELAVEGLKRTRPPITRVRFIVGMESIENWSDNILGEPITISKENHHGFDKIRLIKAEGGKYVPLKDWMSP